jgi:hypothetical protein
VGKRQHCTWWCGLPRLRCIFHAMRTHHEFPPGHPMFLRHSLVSSALKVEPLTSRLLATRARGWDDCPPEMDDDEWKLIGPLSPYFRVPAGEKKGASELSPLVHSDWTRTVSGWPPILPTDASRAVRSAIRVLGGQARGRPPAPAINGAKVLVGGGRPVWRRRRHQCYEARNIMSPSVGADLPRLGEAI